ncbi:MAG: ATP-dependent sacrificial sulfur transferase LarE, partial [Calditrichaeota bacterium]
MELLQGKYLKLQNVLRSFPNLIVAYSGGVDSTFLLKVAFDVLGDKVLGIIGVSPSLPERELTSALEVAQQFHLPVKTIKTEELADDRYNSNPTNRCYFCKKVLFTELFDYARRKGFQYIADGTNADDENDFRPGKQAAKEFNIVSPLKEAGLTKADIRELSFQLHLPTWDKPEMACLASRFPTGTRITAD